MEIPEISGLFVSFGGCEERRPAPLRLVQRLDEKRLTGLIERLKRLSVKDPE